MHTFDNNAIDFEKISVGMTASYSQTITDADIKAYAGLSGDHNPIHVDIDFAKSSHFGNRIAHGLIPAGFFSAMFGTRLPGPGCVYVNQSLNFKKPVYIDDTVVAEIKVLSIDIDRRRVFFETTCRVGDSTVISGEAEIFVPA